MVIKYRIKVHYGIVRRYITNKYKAAAFKNLTGHVCVSLDDMEWFKAFGVEFENEAKGGKR